MKIMNTKPKEGYLKLFKKNIQKIQKNTPSLDRQARLQLQKEQTYHALPSIKLSICLEETCQQCKGLLHISDCPTKIQLPLSQNEINTQNRFEGLNECQNQQQSESQSSMNSNRYSTNDDILVPPLNVFDCGEEPSCALSFQQQNQQSDFELLQSNLNFGFHKDQFPETFDLYDLRSEQNRSADKIYYQEKLSRFDLRSRYINSKIIVVTYENFFEEHTNNLVILDIPYFLKDNDKLIIQSQQPVLRTTSYQINDAFQTISKLKNIKINKETVQIHKDKDKIPKMTQQINQEIKEIQEENCKIQGQMTDWEFWFT